MGPQHKFHKDACTPSVSKEVNDDDDDEEEMIKPFKEQVDKIPMWETANIEKNICVMLTVHSSYIHSLILVFTVICFTSLSLGVYSPSLGSGLTVQIP